MFDGGMHVCVCVSIVFAFLFLLWVFLHTSINVDNDDSPGMFLHIHINVHNNDSPGLCCSDSLYSGGSYKNGLGHNTDLGYVHSRPWITKLISFTCATVPQNKILKCDFFVIMLCTFTLGLG